MNESATDLKRHTKCQQIDSILAQDYKNIRILARDDASTDRTLSILEEYATRFPERFQIVERSPATGSAQGNFLRLMQLSSAPYTAFADQDDVWFPNKLSISMNAMRELEAHENASTPLIVFTDLHVVDQDLNSLHPSFWQYSKIRPENISNLRLLINDSAVTGCTALLNRNLLLASSRMKAGGMMHDWWISLVASALGRAKAVDTPTIYYRQHAHNILGALSKISPIENWRRRLRNGADRRQKRNIHVDHIRDFLSTYRDDLSATQRETLATYVRCYEAKNRIRRAFLFTRSGFLNFASTKSLANVLDI